MERLSDGAIEIINELHRERLDYESEYLPLIECANKCQAYEDTGLEPEEIKQVFTEETVLKVAGQFLGITPDRLRELAQADREGRCVVIRPNSVTDDNYKIICRTINAEDIHLRKVRNVHEKHK